MSREFFAEASGWKEWKTRSLSSSGVRAKGEGGRQAAFQPGWLLSEDRAVTRRRIVVVAGMCEEGVHFDTVHPASVLRYIHKEG